MLRVDIDYINYEKFYKSWKDLENKNYNECEAVKFFIKEKEWFEKETRESF